MRAGGYFSSLFRQQNKQQGCGARERTRAGSIMQYNTKDKTQQKVYTVWRACVNKRRAFGINNNNLTTSCVNCLYCRREEKYLNEELYCIYYNIIIESEKNICGRYCYTDLNHFYWRRSLAWNRFIAGSY